MDGCDREVTNYVQVIIEAVIQVSRLSGYAPQFILEGVSEAIVDDKELDNLAKTWSSPPLPTAVIAIPTFGAGSKKPPHSASDPGITNSSVSAKGMKLSKILQSSQDNPLRHSCVVSLISEAVRRSAYRGCLAISALSGGLLSWCAFHADAGLAIGGGGS
ncbi:MAG: hypothetical protein OK436_04260 [Thaumarchaeota archaeon]|nr:hypothetical protein [Nitrososphaerota archaeon]